MSMNLGLESLHDDKCQSIDLYELSDNLIGLNDINISNINTIFNTIENIVLIKQHIDSVGVSNELIALLGSDAVDSINQFSVEDLKEQAMRTAAKVMQSIGSYINTVAHNNEISRLRSVLNKISNENYTCTFRGIDLSIKLSDSDEKLVVDKIIADGRSFIKYFEKKSSDDSKDFDIGAFLSEIDKLSRVAEVKLTLAQAKDACDKYQALLKLCNSFKNVKPLNRDQLVAVKKFMSFARLVVTSMTAFMIAVKKTTKHI